MTEEKRANLYQIYTYDDFRNKLDAVFQKYGEKVAVTCIVEQGSGRQLTYHKMKEQIGQLHNMLQNAGLKRAERVAVMTKAAAEAVVLNLGLAYLGYTAVLIDAALPQEERNKLLEYADINAVFTTAEDYFQMNCKIRNEVPVFEIKQDFSYRLFNDSVMKCMRKNVAPLYEDVIVVIFSSGTTAEMKGVMVTYNSVLYAQKYIVQYANLNSKDSFLDVLPSNHIAGYSSSMSCLLTGTEVGFILDMSAEKLLSGFLNYNPTDFIMIPKVYEVIKNKIEMAIEKKPLPAKIYAKAAMKICGGVREKTGINLRALTKPIWKAALGRNMKLCGSGTLPCSEEIIRFYLNMGIEFLNVYGATETGFPITAANCNEKYPLKGAGNINQFKEISVLISEPNEEGVGEIRVKTPLIMKGYFREDELTRQAFDEKGYFKTGDLGYIDAEGYLYITGRIKEAILLHNGKKISPIDVDKYYQKMVPNVTSASCGIPTKAGFDSIYLFVEKDKVSQTEINNALMSLKRASDKSSLYKIERVCVIDKIPVTTVGKVKRFQLKKYVDNIDGVKISEVEETYNKDKKNTDKEQELIKIISKYATEKNITLESNMKNELCIDSLTMFELCMEIENTLGISVVNRLDKIETVKDILKDNCIQEYVEKNYSIYDYPQGKNVGDSRYIRMFGNISRRLYDFEVVGYERIPQTENILLCPNHESYFDAMWIASALMKEGYNLDSFCCLAAEHLKDKSFFKKGFRALGGIPVDRGGNTALAMKRAKECLEMDRCCMLIHPEGTRTRNGKLGEFKDGAAKLAIDTGIKIVPVYINGAYQIFSPNARLPRLFDWKRGRRFALQIEFGPAIDPNNKTEKEITQMIREYIEERKNDRENME